MDKFKTVLELHRKHHNALNYGLVTLLTAGGEKISAVVFSARAAPPGTCPTAWCSSWRPRSRSSSWATC